MAANTTGYPTRESHHAHKLTRRLFKSCAAQSIGHHAVSLIIHIAHTEDAARYQGPVRFWNSQLSETLGFKSPKQLNKCRQAAINAGWLHYERDHDRNVGHYWTLIPTNVLKYDDRPIEDTPIHSPNGTESGKLSELGTRNGTGVGTHSGTGSGKPSNPVPNPIPSPKDVVVVDNFSFDSFLLNESAAKLRSAIPRDQREGAHEIILQIAHVGLAIEGPTLLDEIIEAAKRTDSTKGIDTWLGYFKSAIRKACNDRKRDWEELRTQAMERIPKAFIESFMDETTLSIAKPPSRNSAAKEREDFKARAYKHHLESMKRELGRPLNDDELTERDKRVNEEMERYDARLNLAS